MAAYDALLKPLQLKGLTLKNRDGPTERPCSQQSTGIWATVFGGIRAARVPDETRDLPGEEVAMAMALLLAKAEDVEAACEFQDLALGQNGPGKGHRHCSPG